MLPTKFKFIWIRVFRGEDLNVKSKWMTNGRHQVMAKGHMAFTTLPLARFAKKNIKM
jgi:hypothetical protein